MILLVLLLTPILGIFIILTDMFNVTKNGNQTYSEILLLNRKRIKFTALTVSIVNLFVSLILFIFFDFSSNQFQFVQEYHEISHFHIYLGVDGLSIYFVLLTTIITPISLLSN
jgi:NADH:ubiquinone oxidoreductase subunit 4 (subunit M)